MIQDCGGPPRTPSVSHAPLAPTVRSSSRPGNTSDAAALAARRRDRSRSIRSSAHRQIRATRSKPRRRRPGTGDKRPLAVIRQRSGGTRQARATRSPPHSRPFGALSTVDGLSMKLSTNSCLLLPHQTTMPTDRSVLALPDSPVGVTRPTVNRRVTGSSPVGGATPRPIFSGVVESSLLESPRCPALTSGWPTCGSGGVSAIFVQQRDAGRGAVPTGDPRWGLPELTAAGSGRTRLR